MGGPFRARAGETSGGRDGIRKDTSIMYPYGLVFQANTVAIAGDVLT
jgi:hypothetical protein